MTNDAQGETHAPFDTEAALNMAKHLETEDPYEIDAELAADHIRTAVAEVERLRKAGRDALEQLQKGDAHTGKPTEQLAYRAMEADALLYEAFGDKT